MFICSVLLSTKDEAQVSITTPQTDSGLPVPRTTTATQTEGGLSVISKSLPQFFPVLSNSREWFAAS